MREDIRLVIADVDGTLLTPDKILTPRARAAVGAITEVAAAGKSVASGIMGAATGSADVPGSVTPPDIPRGGPHELGSQLPHNPGDREK